MEASDTSHLVAQKFGGMSILNCGNQLYNSEKLKNKSIYIITIRNVICFKIHQSFIAIWTVSGNICREIKKGGQTVSWGHIIQVLLNGAPFVVGGASVILILLQYVLIGIFLMNVFVLIMIRLDKRKFEQQKIQHQQLTKE